MSKPTLTTAEWQDARKAAREVWDRLVQLRQWARAGANLGPDDPHRPDGALFVRWLQEVGQQLPSWRPILERARDAVWPWLGRRVRFGHRVERNALTMLLLLLDQALYHLRGDGQDDPNARQLDRPSAATQCATPIFCETLERTLTGEWDYLWHDLEDDLAGGGAEEPPPPESKQLTFLPGAFYYRGHRHNLAGKPLGVLEALDRAHGKTLTQAALRDQVWGDQSVGDETIRSAVLHARKALRKATEAAGVQAAADPIPVVDRGPHRTAWRLALP
jgi:hypothetical protein